MQTHRSWPVGTSLRFTPEIVIMPDYAHLAGTAVIVLSRPQLMRAPQGPDRKPQLRQLVYSFAAAGEGWVLPAHLESLPSPISRNADKPAQWAIRKF